MHIFFKFLLSAEESFVSDMAMMEKCAEETQELKELKDFLESIGGCITDDTLYSMRTILKGMVKMIKLYDYYREYWFE